MHPPLPPSHRHTHTPPINHYIGRVPQHHYSFHELLKHQNSDLSNRMKKTTIPVNTVPAKEDEQAASGAGAGAGAGAVAKTTDKDPDATNNEANDTAGAAAVSVPQRSHFPPPCTHLSPFLYSTPAHWESRSSRMQWRRLPLSSRRWCCSGARRRRRSGPPRKVSANDQLLQ